MIVCHCRVVSDGDVRRAAEAGARTTGDACRATRAGSGCGTCVFSVKAILDEHVAREQTVRRRFRRWMVQPVDQRVVELLNDALTFELTVTNTYFLHARMLDNWGLPRLGKVYYDLSIDEMKDSDELINRILMFEGHPNVQRLGSISVGETAEEMLRLAYDSEKAAVAQFNASAKECHDLGDHGTAAVFEEMVRDEERHAEWFDAQLAAIERVGVQGYLAQQIDASQGPEPA